MPYGLTVHQPPRGPHISWSLPLTSGFPPTSLFQPLCHPQQHHFLSNRSLKRPQVPSATSLQQPHHQLTHQPISETLLQSSVATLPTPQYKPSPQFTPKTSSLCQAQPRSRISRAAVCLCRPFVFRERVVLCFWDCRGVADATLLMGFVCFRSGTDAVLSRHDCNDSTFDSARSHDTNADSIACIDPFAEADEDSGQTTQTQEYIHIRIQRTFSPIPYLTVA
jgi:hypothetical protein